jgi:hypothetical protein
VANTIKQEYRLVSWQGRISIELKITSNDKFGKQSE